MRGLLLAVALALCAGAAPSQRTIVSLTLNMGGVLCGTSPEDFDATLKTRVPNTNMIPYPYAAIIFQTQEGGYRGQPVEGTAADLVGKVKTALSVPGNFQTITISHDAGFGWIRESWRFLASQTIFYDPSVIAPEGDPLHKFIGKGIKKKAKHFLLQSLRFKLDNERVAQAAAENLVDPPVPDDQTHARCIVDFVSTHLPMSSDETVGKRTGLQSRFDAMKTLLDWRTTPELNRGSNGIVLSGDLNFRVDTGGEQLQVALTSTALGKEGGSPVVGSAGGARSSRGTDSRPLRP
jgi:hypothetical protein